MSRPPGCTQRESAPAIGVGIRVPSGTTDLYVAILSTLWAGAAYVPVDWDDPDSRADTVWEEASVAAVYGKDLAIVDKHGGGNPDHHVPTLDDDAWVIFTSGSTGSRRVWRCSIVRRRRWWMRKPACT